MIHTVDDRMTDTSLKVDNELSADCETIGMLQKKIKLKSEALILLSKELEQCRNQRDQFKLMAEQVQEKFVKFKQQVSDTREQRGPYTMDGDFRTLDILTEVREQNKCLRLQVETLRQKLRDTQGDIKVLRANNSRCWSETQNTPAVHQREEMIEQLEKLNLKCSQLQTDLQTVIDEKHELESELNAFKSKAHRLNHELSKALNATKPVDLDALINENRYLQERLQQSLEEKKLTHQSLLKYKSMLDSKKVKGTLTLGANSAAGSVMTHKQVEQLLQEGCHVPPHKSAAAIADLRCLCTALLEALNDKTLALVHQRKTNKILALRICELDNAIQSPTMKLLEGYAVNDEDNLKELNCPSTETDVNEIEENNIMTNEVVTTSTGESHVMQQIHSLQMSLPKNLSVLVQKALNNLKENNRS